MSSWLILGAPVLYDLVSAESLMALAAVHKRIGKSAEMSRRYPCLRIHKYCGVKSDVVRVLLNELSPPCFFDVVLHLDAERTVVPCVGKTAVDFAACEYEASVFTERYDFFH